MARLLEDEHAVLVVTDPPYGVAYEGGTTDKLTIANDDLEDAPSLSFLTAALGNMLTVTRPGGAIYICHADSRGLVFRQAFVDAADGRQRAQCQGRGVWHRRSGPPPSTSS